jgi:predicted metalloendopeptidase
MLQLIGEKPEQAQADAKTVLSIETELARASMDRTLRRDPRNRDHWMSAAELEKLAPNFEFTRFFEGVSSPKFTELNVANPEFFKQINSQLNAVPLDQWKTYLRWRTVKNQAPLLSKAFVDGNFSWTQYMSGQKELEARWKRCVKYTDVNLGEALGQLYVDKTFGKEGKERTMRMVQAIERAMDRDIKEIDWMTPKTKERAMEKLQTIVNNIGYPDKWRDYSSVKVTRDDAVGNDRRATMFESNRQYQKIGKPVDRKEWTMTPPTVNAYYRSANNDINFPAGILQPPFYSNKIDDAVNFGGIGVVIGHELTHGFDDQGRKFDAQGNLKDWWTPEDGKEFEKRASCIDEQYSGYSVETDKGPANLNGKLTLGENTADNGGSRLAYMALHELIGDKDPGPVDGFTTDQRFFLGYAQVWCQNVTPQESGVRVKTDPHSPGRYRVIGVISNSPEFQKAFSCKPGDNMVRQNACRVW